MKPVQLAFQHFLKKNISFDFLFAILHVSLIVFLGQIVGTHLPDASVGVGLVSGKVYHRQKTPLVISETQTHIQLSMLSQNSSHSKLSTTVFKQLVFKSTLSCIVIRAKCIVESLSYSVRNGKCQSRNCERLINYTNYIIIYCKIIYKSIS